MPLVRMAGITREFVRAHPDWIFVFGDNIERRGMGGQAAAMRGEPNAFGFRTKRRPTMDSEAFFSDHDPWDSANVFADLMALVAFLKDGKVVVMPAAGVGAGLSRMPEKCPQLYDRLTAMIDTLERFFGKRLEELLH